MAPSELEALFLPAGDGRRFALARRAADVRRGGVLFVHAFGEEMNKSRRMAALQARMLAEQGFSVLQIDLYGCGDSSGDFGDARWDIWREDVALGVRCLKKRVSAPIQLWGLRLGALLALDFGATAGEVFNRFLLWQPVISGEAFLTQFLRLRVATGMLDEQAPGSSTQGLRAELEANAMLEIAGYDLAPELARAIDRLKLADLAPHGVPVHWFEVAPEAGRPLSPASRRVADAWIGHGVDVNVRTVAGEPFWTTIEIAECRELLTETTRTVVEMRP